LVPAFPPSRRHCLKDMNITNDICRKFRKKLETIQHITLAPHALAQDDYSHCHNQVTNIFHQELAIKFRLLKAPPMSYYKCEPQSVSTPFLNYTTTGP